MFRRMPIRRAVATERGAALLARSQVHPGASDLDALLAFPLFRPLDVRDDRRDVSAGFSRHVGVSVVKDLVHEGDRNRAFTDGGRDPLDVAAPHVTHGEHAGKAGLE